MQRGVIWNLSFKHNGKIPTPLQKDICNKTMSVCFENPFDKVATNLQVGMMMMFERRRRARGMIMMVKRISFLDVFCGSGLDAFFV